MTRMAEHREPFIREGGDDMDWYWWALIGIGALLLAGIALEFPAIRRYLRIKSM